MCQGVVRIQVDRPFKESVSLRKIPTVHPINKGKRNDSLRQFAVEAQGVFGSCTCLRKSVLRRNGAPDAQQDVTIRETGVGKRVIWVLCDGFIKVFDPTPESVFAAFVPEIPAL